MAHTIRLAFRPGRFPIRRAVLLGFLGVVVLAAGCSSGGEVDDGLPGSSAQSSVADDIVGQPVDGDGADAGGDPASGGDGGTGDDQAQDGGEPSDEPTDPSVCSVDQVNTKRFYMVTNIPDDDPDGGLNLRNDYQDGERLTTLADRTVVLVEDCVIADDGGTWFAVETAEGDGGWANAAFLTSEIDPLLPTSGGQETERTVVAVLDALAARKWDEAAAELEAGGSGVLTLDRFLEQGSTAADDLPQLLAVYCQIRLCDAPYEVVETRGSYIPDRVPPEVDVRFDYPAGSTIETFRRLDTADGQGLNTLPGQSVLAWTTNRPAAAALVTDPGAEADGLLEAAEAVRLALLSEDGPQQLAAYVPDEGTTFSSNSYVDPRQARRVTVTTADLSGDPATADQLRIWGYQDGIGTAIVETVPGWIAQYRRAPALLEPDVVGVDERVGRSNTIANLAEVYPNATVVEFHRRGRGELVDFNWSSVRLALEERPQGWVVVAITSDSWTI